MDENLYDELFKSYGLEGINDKSSFEDQLKNWGEALMAQNPSVFQFQNPELSAPSANSSDDTVNNLAALLSGSASGLASQIAQAYQGNNNGGGQNRINALRNADQQALSSKSGGGLLGGLLGQALLGAVTGGIGNALGAAGAAVGNALSKGVGLYGKKFF